MELQLPEPSIHLAPLKNWFAGDEALAGIVGDRVSTRGMAGYQLPALGIFCVHGEDEADTYSVFQLDFWAEGEHAKTLAEKMRPILRARIGTIPSDLLTNVKVIRDDLVGMAPHGEYGERRRLSIDFEANRSAVVR